jgi:hypothetical protein
LAATPRTQQAHTIYTQRRNSRIPAFKMTAELQVTWCSTLYSKCASCALRQAGMAPTRPIHEVTAGPTEALQQLRSMHLKLRVQSQAHGVTEQHNYSAPHPARCRHAMSAALTQHSHWKVLDFAKHAVLHNHHVTLPSHSNNATGPAPSRSQLH